MNLWVGAQAWKHFMYGHVMAVAPEYWRQHLAKRLMNILEEVIRCEFCCLDEG